MENTTHVIAKLRKMKGHKIHRIAPVYWGKGVRDDSYMDMAVVLVGVSIRGMWVRMPEYFGYSAPQLLEIKFMDGDWETVDEWPEDWRPNVERKRVG